MAMFRCSGGGDKEYTQLSPSNSSPAPIGAGAYYETTGSGYAVEYFSEITPSSIGQVHNGEIVKFGGNGFVVDNLDLVTPSDDNPPKIEGNSSCFNRESYAGYLVRGPVSTITPSNSSPAAMSAYNVYFSDGAGYAIASYSSLTPSDSSPAAITSGGIYKAAAGGYAIESSPISVTPSSSSPYPLVGPGAIFKFDSNGVVLSSAPQGKTPSDANPPPVSVGDIISISNNGGYLYKTQRGAYSEEYSDLTSNTSKTITGLTVGKHYLALVYMVLATNMTYNRFDGCTTSDGTLTKVSNMGTTSAHGVGTFYDLVPSAASVTITLPNNGFIKVLND